MVDYISRGKFTVNDAEAVTKNLTELSYGAFVRSDLSSLIEPFSSRLETYLRTFVLPDSRRADRLVALIDNLHILGMPQHDIDGLHELRQLYNKSKHKPHEEMTMVECLFAMRGVKKALMFLANKGIPALDAPAQVDHQYHIWVGFWDDYSGGETNVQLMLPSDHSLLVELISNFHFPILAWDEVKPLLISHPKFSLGREFFEENVWDSLSKEGDFLNAGIWEGDYRELLELLAPFNDKKLEDAVFQNLARSNSMMSVGLAVICAAIDISRSGLVFTDVEGLISAILSRSETEYAIQIDRPHVLMVTENIAKKIHELPPLLRTAITGPAIRRKTKAEGVEVNMGIPIHIENATIVWTHFAG